MLSSPFLTEREPAGPPRRGSDCAEEFLLTLLRGGGNIAREHPGAPMQDLYAEFKAVVRAFNASGIPYALCGGLAYAIHVRPRATLDMDFLIQAAERPNALRWLRMNLLDTSRDS